MFMITLVQCSTYQEGCVEHGHRIYGMLGHPGAWSPFSPDSDSGWLARSFSTPRMKGEFELTAETLKLWASASTVNGVSIGNITLLPGFRMNVSVGIELDDGANDHHQRWQ